MQLKPTLRTIAAASLLVVLSGPARGDDGRLPTGSEQSTENSEYSSLNQMLLSAAAETGKFTGSDEFEIDEVQLISDRLFEVTAEPAYDGFQVDDVHQINDLFLVQKMMPVARVVTTDGDYLVDDAIVIPPSIPAQPVFFPQQEVDAFQPPDFSPSAFQPPDFGGGLSFDLDPTVFRAASNNAPLVQGISSEQSAVLQSSDLVGVMRNANTVQTLSAQRRSPVSMDPHIRGYSYGQIYSLSDGVYWSPVRQDLDTMLSKIDPALIKDVVIIPGPYGLRYGPGLAFIDVQTYDTPRYDGFESHARVGLSAHTNGGQAFGRATAYGGSNRWGYVFSYGNRTGSDYRPGGAAPISRIPSSYHNQSFLGQLGLDMFDNSRLEFRYNRLDVTDTEYAAQIFDVNFLITDNLAVSFVTPDEFYGGEFRVEGWYNRTPFAGDTTRAGKRLPVFSVVDRIEGALGLAPGELLGQTDGDITSTGIRTSRTFGEDDCNQFRVGADVRYVQQHIYERFDDITGAVLPAPIQTNLPRADMIDPGVYAEWTYNWTPFMATTMGGRADYVHTDAQAMGGFPDGLRPGSSLAGAPATLPQNDVLYAFYLNSEVYLTQELDLRVGFGHAQRVPTLTERYADGVFLGIIQSGFSRVVGDPALRKERAWQIDVSLEADYGFWRGRASGFYSWILDYITYEANIITDPTGARLLFATNSDLGTLGGFELYGETDVTETLAAFGSVQYVEGRDREINVALPQIAPLEGRAGLRLHEPSDDPYWSLEFGARIVDDQDRIAYLRTVGVTGVVSLEDPTPGFSVFYLRGYYAYSDALNIVGGVENLFDRSYLEHLDLRLPDSPPYVNTRVFSPGITPYFGIEWRR